MPQPMDPNKIKTAKMRLIRALGDAEAARLWSVAVRSVPGGALRSPQDLQTFADVLMRQGGMAQIVGRTLSMHALLCGAKKTA